MLPRPAATREADGSAASSATSPVATSPGPPQTLADLLADPSAEVEGRIWDAVRSDPAVHFITGPAGTGKSHLLRLLADAIPEGLVLLAPTGISAVNVRGQTLHRFFRLEKGVQSTAHDGVHRPTDLYRAISTLIIDEVSMVRADVLDKIDAILRRSRRPDLPFGGIRVIAVGDSLQLPPVVTKEEWPLLQRLGYQGPYFFDAHVAQVADMRVFLLSRIHRQREKKFVDLLSAVRVGQVTPEKLEFLNRRVVPEAVANAAGSSVVTTRRWRAEMRNEQQLQALPTPEQLYEGRVEGLFPSNQLPVPRRLALRPGARVLFVKNDQDSPYGNTRCGMSWCSWS